MRCSGLARIYENPFIAFHPRPRQRLLLLFSLMEKPLFQISAQGWKSTNQVIFYSDRVEHEWKTPPTASGKYVYLRDSLSPYLSSQRTFGWGASSSFRSSAWFLGIGLILQQGFGKPVLRVFGILFYVIAAAFLFYGLTRLRRQEWVYIQRRDGGTLVTLLANTIEDWSLDEFRKRFETYVRGEPENHATPAN